MSSFADPIIFLFIGSFIISDAFFKSGLSDNVAKIILRFSGKKLIFLLIAVSWFMSFWFSNTAVTIMVLPVISSLDFRDDTKKFLYLAVAFGASAGGMATPVGTPPNLIAIGFLRDQNINLNFLDWMKIGIPASVLIFISILIIVFAKLIKGKGSEQLLKGGDTKIKIKIKLSSDQKKVLIVFLSVVFMWLAPSLTKVFGVDFPISESMAALIGAFLLFLLGVQDLSTFGRIDWNTIFLFGGGLTLGRLFLETGLSETFGTFVSSLLPGSEELSLFIVLLMSIFLTEFISNTAVASSLIPIFASFCVSRDLLLTPFILSVALGSSCAFMLPIATPPNAIVYSQGNLGIRFMMRYGFIVDLVSLLSIYIILKHFFI